MAQVKNHYTLHFRFKYVIYQKTLNKTIEMTSETSDYKVYCTLHTGIVYIYR